MINRVFNSFIGLAFITLYILGHFEFQFVLPTIIGSSIISIGFGYIVFKFNKKKLSTVAIFIRQGMSVKLLLPMLLPVIAYFPFEFFIDSYLGLNEKDGAPFYTYLPLAIGMYLGGMHQNFINAIKIYQNGLELPGPTSPLILWDEVKSIKREGQMVTIETTKKVNSFKTLEIDNSNIDSIITQLESRK